MTSRKARRGLPESLGEPQERCVHALNIAFEYFYCKLLKYRSTRVCFARNVCHVPGTSWWSPLWFLVGNLEKSLTLAFQQQESEFESLLGVKMPRLGGGETTCSLVSYYITPE